ncbi:VIT domain-containing protein [Actinomadura atramentaria]|uniref:VIT domain-containing protein n=1 Tax=Actinomadura atramentaria TaxID=1990 RepID=UPI0003A177B4|nr:VIT domain-containing protein [Actinomadura atramentaria]
MTVRIAPLDDPEPPVAEPPGGGLGALTTERGNLPLDTVDVRASITGLAAGLDVVQGFRNPFDVPLEATYVFPLPDRAAVTALRMEVADRVVDGVLAERGAARARYDAAVAAGQRAAIAEEDRPDVFTLRVGNIPPGERVTVRLTLSQPLPYETSGSGGVAEFRFPLVVARRYVPGAPLDGEQAGRGVAPDTDAVPDASRISPPVLLPGFPNPVRLGITVDVDTTALPLTEIRSALHVVSEESAPGRTTVRLDPGERLDRDFVLRLGYGAAEVAALALAPDRDETGGTFTLTVLPSGEHRVRPRDVVLVLDRSGSMGGWKMVCARRAAARIVDTLTADDRFAVLSFDTVTERPDLPAGLNPATDRNRFRAVEHLAAVDARGGTEMLAPLDEAAGLLADAGRDRVLVLITDGQVGNEDQLLARLLPRLTGVRVHTVGIDRAVNAGFLHRLAAGGRCELVESEDRLDAAMEAIHHRIGAPLVTGLELVPAGLAVDPDSVAPRRFGALYPGSPLVVAGRYTGPPTGDVVLRGTAANGEPWERRLAPAVVDAPAAGAIWARAHLRDLEDRYVIEGTVDQEQRIVRTSLRFGVLCRFTAFVAVDSERVNTTGQAPHQVIQPVEDAFAQRGPVPVPPAVPGAPAPGAPAPRRAKRALRAAGDRGAMPPAPAAFSAPAPDATAFGAPPAPGSAPRPATPPAPSDPPPVPSSTPPAPSSPPPASSGPAPTPSGPAPVPSGAAPVPSSTPPASPGLPPAPPSRPAAPSGPPPAPPAAPSPNAPAGGYGAAPDSAAERAAAPDESAVPGMPYPIDRPVPPTPAAPPLPEPETTKAVLARELQALRTFTGTEPERRTHLLYHLLPILEAALNRVGPNTLNGLNDLVTALHTYRANPTPPTTEALWTRTITALDTITTPPKRSFWKRSR